MITSLQNFFLKHNKWLFGSLLIVIIVTFVLTIGPQSFFGSGAGGPGKTFNFFGRNLGSDADQREIAYTAEVSAIFHPEMQIGRQQLLDYGYMRVAGLGIADQLGIPNPTKDALSEYVESLMIFMDPTTGEFSAESYNRIMDSLKLSGRYEEEVIGKVLREDYRIDEVMAILGGPDYSLPFEIEKEYLDGQTSYNVTLANLEYADFNPVIVPTVEQLQQFFNQNPARYEIGESISVSAIKFRAASYLAEVNAPTEADLTTYFATNRARYEAAREKPEDESEELPELTLADVREQVETEWKQQQANGLAARAGEQFSIRLYQDQIALDSAEYNALVSELKGTVRQLPSYARGNSPRTPDAPVQLLDSMWVYSTNPNRYFSDVARIADGAVVLVMNNVTQARMPEFGEVVTQVTDDFNQSEKRRMFAEKGVELAEAITSRLASESFADIASSLSLTTNELGSFTGAELPEDLRGSTVWDQARFLNQGEVSKMVIEGDTGVFAFVAEKTVPELDPTDADYQTFLTQRSNFLQSSLGLYRLREITDKGLASVLGTNPFQE